MRHVSGDTVICYNGEIYNYLELTQRLKAEGVSFTSQSDTEVLIEAYRRWGIDFLSELNGMFSFALYDAPRRRLIAARDRYGEKPFLYVSTPGFFAFASEYKALLALAEVDDGVDAGRALRFLVRGSEGLDDERLTAFPAVQQLLPGECLTLNIDTLTVSVQRYWTLRPDSDAARLDFPAAANRLRELLTDSVRLRLRSDVPVGSCLSGGLDSGSIVCLARNQRGSGEYHAFSGRFPGTAVDEGPFIESVARATRATVHQVAPRPERLLEELPAFVWHNELPVSSASQYAQWCVFRLARQEGVIVLLDGQGGDELLAGYEQHFRAYVGEGGVGRKEHDAIRQRYPVGLAGLSERAKRMLPSGMRRILAHQTGRGSDMLFGIETDAASAIAAASEVRNGGWTGLQGVLFQESFHTVLPTLLRYGDRNSMAHSVEVRLPFCDHRLAEFIFALPPSYLMGNAQTKRLLREAMRGILPETVRTRWNKQGFMPPQDIWMRERLAIEVEAMIAAPEFAARGYWNVAWWRSAISRFKAGDSTLSGTLWKLFVAEAWQRHFVERVRRQDKVSLFGDTVDHARDLHQSLPS